MSSDFVDRALIVDDEAGVRDLLSDVASELGFVTRRESSAENIIRVCREFRPTLIVLDVSMPQLDGVEALRLLSAHAINAGIMLVSGMDNRVLNATDRLARELGFKVFGTMQKPFDVNQMEQMFRKVREQTGAITVAELQEALEDGTAFTLHYQPKVKPSPDGRWLITAAEALVRWQHPTRGLVMPGLFVPLAERHFLAQRLTDIVIDLAVEQIKEWQSWWPSVSIRINIPVEYLEDLELPDRLEAQLKNAGIQSADHMGLELTETGVMSNITKALDVLVRCRIKGFELSIDDFGIGYSSLVQLFRLPFSELKIDRSFVIEVDTSEEARAIIRATIALAKSLNLNVCAEGVESQSAVDYLAELGCNLLQGYFISKPLPPEQFVKLVNEPMFMIPDGPA